MNTYTGQFNINANAHSRHALICKYRYLIKLYVYIYIHIYRHKSQAGLLSSVGFDSISMVLNESINLNSHVIECINEDCYPDETFSVADVT